MPEGDNVQKRRKNDVVSLETLDTRVTALEEGYHDLRRQTMDMANEVRANTRLTEEIHGEVGVLREDTQGLVEFVKRADESWTKWKARGTKFRSGSASTGKWLAAVTGGAIGVVSLGKLLGWW